MNKLQLTKNAYGGIKWLGKIHMKMVKTAPMKNMK